MYRHLRVFPFLARYLQSERRMTGEEVRITLVDGDAFETGPNPIPISPCWPTTTCGN